MPDDVKISEMSEAASLDNSAQFPYVQSMNGNLTTLKAPLSQIGTKINEGMTFSNLQTTSKNIVGAINEAAQGGGVEYATELPISSTDPTNTKAYIDTKTTLVKSASGSLIHITDGGDNIPMKSLESEIVAVESGSGEKSPTNPYTISGFDSGVITRCGKNFVPMTVASVKAINTLGTWSGNTYTYNNVVFTLQTDIDGNITGISANGTANATSQIYIANNYTLQKGNYILNGCPSGGGTETARLQVNTGVLNIDTGSGANITLTEVYNSCVCFIRIGSGYNPNGMVFKPMVRVASDTDDTFAISKGNTYTFTFGQTVYGGHFDNKGNLVVTRVCKRLTTAYNMSGAYQGSIIYNVSSEETSDADFTKPIMCNNLQYVGTSLSNFVYGTCINYLGASFNLWLKNGAFSDLAEATQWLADNPTYICYYLATPITLAITSQDIPTLSGENNIFSNCGDTAIEYFTSSADEVANLVRAEGTYFHKYSTSEHIVGVWVDNKTLYEKTVVIEGTNLTAGQSNSIAHGISNIDFIQITEGSFIFGNGTVKMPLPFSDEYKPITNSLVVIEGITDTAIKIGVGSNYINNASPVRAWITLQYTKTT